MKLHDLTPTEEELVLAFLHDNYSRRGWEFRVNGDMVEERRLNSEHISQRDWHNSASLSWWSEQIVITHEIEAMQ